MPHKANPAGNPGREGSTPRLGKHGRPEIPTTTGRIRAAKLWSWGSLTRYISEYTGDMPAVLKPTNNVKKAFLMHSD